MTPTDIGSQMPPTIKQSSRPASGRSWVWPTELLVPLLEHGKSDPSKTAKPCMISTIAPESLVVEPAVEGVVVPFVGGLALRLRQRLLGLQRVVDDDDVGTSPGQHAADRGGD